MNKKDILLTTSHFHLGDIPDAWQAWMSDSDWEVVSLPHDWSVTQPFSKKHSSGTGYLPGGVAWYRIHITPDNSWKNKHISITFDGIYKNSRVWCNSSYLGERPNGYISFTYDITDVFRFDSDNIISIYVDHRDISDSRWFTGSGITQNVTLHVQEAIHAKTDGIFFSTPQVSANQAMCNITNEIENSSSVAKEIVLHNYLIDQNNTIVATAKESALLPAASSQPVHTGFVVKNPSLWSPDTPTLYTLKTTLQIMDNPTPEEYITDITQVGIRSYDFCPDKGFFLNGIPQILKGVCIHHDAGCLGAAVPAVVWKRRLQKLKSMGCNAIRMSHNPHMPELYDLCDSMGFLVIDEAFDEWEGPKNKWSTGHNVYPPKHQGYYLDFPNWHERDLTDMIRKNRNHASIILWSIGNEIDYPNDPYCHPSFEIMTGNNDANKPANERQYNPFRPNIERLTTIAKQLYQIVKKADSTRPVTLAAAFPELSSTTGFTDAVDVIGYNYKEHLYEQDHIRFPNKPFIGSENSHGFAAWKAVTDNDYISGQFLWTGIDFLGEAHGWPIHGSGAGLLTLAGFEKSTYFRRQSFWSTEPMVHLCTAIQPEQDNEYIPVSECWNYPMHEMILIKCYTNLSKVEFLLNNQSVGIYEKNETEDCISFTLPFEPGTLQAKGITEDAASAPTHILYTTGCACEINVDVWDNTYETAYGKPFYQLELTMLDLHGHRVYSDSTMIHIDVQNGQLIGLENGDLADNTEYAAPYRRAKNGQLLVYVVANDNSPVKLTITAEGLKTQIVTLDLHS